MPREIRAQEDDESRDRMSDHDDDNRFSQDDDDKAGRSWHGLNSEVASDEVGRFEEDEDDFDLEEIPRPGRTERV
jgi:hypothetical protein